MENKEEIKDKEKLKKIENDIKEVIENRGFLSIFSLRDRILKEEIKNTKILIENLNLEELLNLKYTLKLKLLNFNLRNLVLIVITVCLTEFIKNVVKIEGDSNYFLIGIIVISIMFLMDYIMTIVIYKQYNGLFIRERKKEILIGLIDFEIKKRE